MTWLKIGFVLRERTGVPELQSAPQQTGDCPDIADRNGWLRNSQCCFSLLLFYVFPTLFSMKTRLQLTFMGRGWRRAGKPLRSVTTSHISTEGAVI